MIEKTEQGYYVCHDGGNTIHYIDLSNGGVMSTGQEFVEMFNTEQEAIERINELADDATYFDEHFAIKAPINA